MVYTQTSFNFHPTRDLAVKVTALNDLTPRPSETFCVELSENGHYITIFFSSGEVLTKFSEDLQQKILDARMAQEEVPA